MVLELAPQYCRPGGPAIANHLIHHVVVNDMPRRRAGPRSSFRKPKAGDLEPPLRLKDGNLPPSDLGDCAAGGLQAIFWALSPINRVFLRFRKWFISREK